MLKLKQWWWNCCRRLCFCSVCLFVYLSQPLKNLHKTVKDNTAGLCTVDFCGEHVSNHIQIPKQQKYIKCMFTGVIRALMQSYAIRMEQPYQVAWSIYIQQGRTSCTTHIYLTQTTDNENRWQVLLEWVGLPSGIHPHVHCIQWFSVIPSSFL